jgi:DNA (cytosine-5)-methyltransferase 1
MKNSKPTVVSLFCGAGGMDLGLKKAGLNIVWANDNDKDCLATYKSNFGGQSTCILSDVAEVKSEDIPNSDLIVGGFPCQGFSVANKYRSVDDSRNKLYLEMLRIIGDKKPKWFIAENVRGILSIGKGKVLERIINDFSNAGYKVNYRLVNMADYGVPQMRKRVIILGSRNDLPINCHLYFPAETHSKRGHLLTRKWVSFNTALQELEKYNDIPDKAIGSKYKMTVRDFTGHRKPNGNEPSPTILARGNGGGGVNATPHPSGLRRLTVRESAWIQTFPIDFRFVGSVNSTYRQIGNSVPVLYAQRLGEMVLDVYQKMPS